MLPGVAGDRHQSFKLAPGIEPRFSWPACRDFWCSIAVNSANRQTFANNSNCGFSQWASALVSLSKPADAARLSQDGPESRPASPVERVSCGRRAQFRAARSLPRGCWRFIQRVSTRAIEPRNRQHRENERRHLRRGERSGKAVTNPHNTMTKARKNTPVWLRAPAEAGAAGTAISQRRQPTSIPSSKSKLPSSPMRSRNWPASVAAASCLAIASAMVRL